MDIFPIFFALLIPATITAPGDMILKRGETMEISVRIAPRNVSLNSAQRLVLCAIILWAISCVKKEVVRIIVNVVNIKGPPITWRVYGKMPIDSPMPVTSSAAIVRCLISLLLKCIFPFVGSVGAEVRVYS